jgi:predicted transcriptional regulator
LVREPRDRTYIRKDIIFTLSEHGELNKTRLLSYCGLNMAKHQEILDDMVKKELIDETKEPWGNKTTTKYNLAEKGREFWKTILEPYEEMFPRVKNTQESEN